MRGTFIWWWRKAFWHRIKAEKAEAVEQRARSEELRKETNRELVGPLAASNRKNGYSEIIRDALQLGYGPPNGSPKRPVSRG